MRKHQAMLWIWPGDPAHADPALIPDFAFNVDAADNRVVRGYTPVAADYEIANDNLLNLSHIEFLHVGTFAGAGVIFQGQYAAHRNGDVVDLNWWMPRIDPPPFAREISGNESRSRLARDALACAFEYASSCRRDGRGLSARRGRLL